MIAVPLHGGALRRFTGLSWRTIRIRTRPPPFMRCIRSCFICEALEPAISSGSVVWVNNSEPDSILSFLRKSQESEVLVMVNMSNRDVHVTLDLPVMDDYALDNLLEPGKIWFQLYSGRVSADLGAFSYIVGKKIPLAPLEH